VAFARGTCGVAGGRSAIGFETDLTNVPPRIAGAA